MFSQLQNTAHIYGRGNMTKEIDSRTKSPEDNQEPCRYVMNCPVDSTDWVRSPDQSHIKACTCHPGTKPSISEPLLVIIYV